MERPTSLYISHGAPDVVLHDTAAKRFLENAGTTFSKPKGIIIASAHFEAAVPTIVSDETPEMIYDFGGFDPKLREMVYPAKGSRALASKVGTLLETASIEHETLKKRGFDHGTWVPLSLLYAEADIPVVQLSIQPNMPPSHHYQLGAALRPLVEEDVLIIGSGSLTHNLGALFGSNGIKYAREDDEVEWARIFADWVSQKIDDAATEELLNYRSEAPFAVENHPTDEHLLPLFVALGASTSGQGRRLHQSTEFSILAMDAFAFQ